MVVTLVKVAFSNGDSTGSTVSKLYARIHACEIRANEVFAVSDIARNDKVGCLTVREPKVSGTRLVSNANVLEDTQDSNTQPTYSKVMIHGHSTRPAG